MNTKKLYFKLAIIFGNYFAFDSIVIEWYLSMCTLSKYSRANALLQHVHR